MKAPRLALTLAVAALLVAGCGGDDEPDRSEPEIKRGGPNVVTVTGQAQRTLELADVEEARISIGGDPDWLTAFAGSVWVKRDIGFVNRVDTKRDRITGEVRADTKSDLCQGIGSGGGAVWSCSASDVVRIDAARMRVVASVPVGKVPNQGKLVFSAGRIWAITGNGDRLTGIDARTNRAGMPVKLPVACDELAPGPSTVWVLCPQADRVIAIDPAKGEVSGQVEVAGPLAGAASATDLWVGSDDGLIRIDARSLEQKARFTELRLGTEAGIAVDGDSVWLRRPGHFLDRIDARTNTIAEHVDAGGELAGGDVVVAGGSVWTSAFEDDDLLLRLKVPGS